MRRPFNGVGRPLFIAALLLFAGAPASAVVINKPAVKAGVAIPKCPALPSLPSTYVDAVAVLGKEPRFVPRKNDVAGQQPRGTILRTSPVTQKGVQCHVVFDVSDGSLVRVPPLSGLLPQDAMNRLKDSNLQAQVSTQNSNRPAGRVFDQSPAAGNVVTKGTTVSVFVAAAALVDVPNVIGRQLDEARKLLGSFSVQDRARASARPRGEVIDQDPRAPAQRALGSSISVVVSDGSLTVVPQLVGRTPTQATDLLKVARLRANLFQQPSDRPVGQVFRQIEPAGSSVQVGTTITAYVATPLPLSVPNVIGLQQNDATARLNRFTVDPNQRQSTRPRGQVVDQDPRAPAQRPPESTVRIFVSDGSRVVVPDVMRIQLDAARKKISESDLQTGAIEQIENRATPGVVLTQDPPPNTEVQRGSTVTLRLSTGLAVPFVEGDMLNEAREKLASFRVATKSTAGVEPAGRVVTQNIKPPARAAAGARIDLEVSDGSLVVIPRVENMSFADATKVLSSAGFLAERGAGPDFNFATVISQQPAAGGPAARGSSVSLTVTWPQWFWWGVAAALLLAIAALSTLLKRAWPRWKPRPPKPPSPPVNSAVRIDPGSVASTVTDAQPSGPELRLATRIEPGTSTITLTDGDPQ